MFNKNVFPLLLVHLITVILVAYGLDRNEGDSCFIDRSQQEGICTRKHECDMPCGDEMIRHQRCREVQRGKQPIVCCPIARPTKSISGKKCLEYKELACNRLYIASDLSTPIITKVSNCARNSVPVRRSIIPGGEATKRQFPHMALIRWDDDNGRCNGILVSDQFVLSSAHCLENSHGRPLYVRLGEHDRSSDFDAEHIDIKVADVIVHPDYIRRYFYNDIGLIKLERPVQFSDAIRPACLPEEPTTADTVYATATGWEYRRQGKSSDVLLQMDLKLLDRSNCSDYIRPNRKTPLGYREETQLCAGSEDCGEILDGPLQIQHQHHYCTYTIIGVNAAASTNGCYDHRNQSIGLYTRVYPYLSWIESVVWPEHNASE